MEEGLARELLQPTYNGMSGDTYSWVIPDILEIESTLRRDMPDVPGLFAPTYYQAEAVVQKYTDHGRDWDFAGKNSFQGRLLLPPEEPSDKVIATIRAGTASEGVDVNPYTRTAVVTNRADGTISLIDLDTQKQVKTIPIGIDPIGPKINPYTNIAVVPARGDDAVHPLGHAEDADAFVEEPPVFVFSPQMGIFKLPLHHFKPENGLVDSLFKRYRVHCVCYSSRHRCCRFSSPIINKFIYHINSSSFSLYSPCLIL